MGERQLRIRARGTRGSVAGAARYIDELTAQGERVGLPTQRTPMKPQHPRRPTLRTTPDATAAPRPPSSYRYIAGWGEDGALDAIREYAETIDAVAGRIEAALDDDSTTATPAPSGGRSDLADALTPLVRGCSPPQVSDEPAG